MKATTIPQEVKDTLQGLVRFSTLMVQLVNPEEKYALQYENFDVIGVEYNTLLWTLHCDGSDWNVEFMDTVDFMPDVFSFKTATEAVDFIVVKVLRAAAGFKHD